MERKLFPAGRIMRDHVEVPATDPADRPELTHEQLVLRRGERSSLLLAIAVHSTALGPAVGGCRMSVYPNWQAGLSDAMRLSEAMSLKCAAAELDHGGGKSVIMLSPSTQLTPELRTSAMLDLGDLIEELHGRYSVGPDVGTNAHDMSVVRQRTSWAAKLAPGPADDPLDPTALGVLEAIKATARYAVGRDTLDGVRVTVIGLGKVGEPLTQALLEQGAVVSATDVIEDKRAVAQAIGARWVTGGEALFQETDIIAPCALGGIFTVEATPRLRCRAIAGAANNQLSAPSVADSLAASGILWAPDFVANAGGVVFGTRTDLDGWDPRAALSDVRRIGPRLDGIFARAEATQSTPLHVATALAHERLASADLQ